MQRLMKDYTKYRGYIEMQKLLLKLCFYKNNRTNLKTINHQSYKNINTSKTFYTVVLSIWMTQQSMYTKYYN